jgi:hypothetical protein
MPRFGRRFGRRFERNIARRLPQPARDAAPLPPLIDEQVEHVAALAQADEAGQLAVHPRGVVDEAGRDVGAQAIFAVPGQEVAGTLGGRFVQDEVEGGAAQQRGGGREIGVDEGTDGEVDDGVDGHVDKITCAAAPASGTIARPFPTPP